MAILEVRNIEKHFGRTNVLKDVSFSMEEGNALAIIGSSGSGKTTLLRCLNFLERPDSGQIIVNGETLFDASEAGKDKDAELRKKRLHFGMVFQQFNLFPRTQHLRMSLWQSAFWHRRHLSLKRIKKQSLHVLMSMERNFWTEWGLLRG